MTRSTCFLPALGLMLLTLPLRAADADSSGAEKLGWKLTLQTWTCNRKSLFEAMELARQIGVKYIEVFPGQTISADDKNAKFGPGMSDAQIQAVLAKAQACGVQIIDCGVMGIPGKEPEIRKLFDWAKKVGLTTLVSEPDPKTLPAIDKVACEYGIHVALHNHPKPSKYWDPEFAAESMKGLKNVGYCADLGHWKRSGLVPVEVLKKHGERVVSLHFKDLASGKGHGGLSDVPWGTGESHAAEMLAVLKEKGFHGPVAIEYESHWEVPTLQQCVNFFYAEANKLAK